MGAKVFAAVLAAFFMAALWAAPADAATKKKNTAITYDARGHTVFTSRGEDGRRRTRIIIQKRSYLDPGTEVFPGENSDHNYAFSPTYSPTSVLDNTAFGGNRSALPGAFDLRNKNGPLLKF